MYLRFLATVKKEKGNTALSLEGVNFDFSFTFYLYLTGWLAFSFQISGFGNEITVNANVSLLETASFFLIVRIVIWILEHWINDEFRGPPKHQVITILWHFLGSPLAIDMSSAILALAENSDLRRIHDKWLMQSTCSLESTEIETSQLNLSSFWGL
ncbi:hypothetical protein V6N13_143814 [Hibiscus sabdariffa]